MRGKRCKAGAAPQASNAAGGRRYGRCNTAKAPLSVVWVETAQRGGQFHYQD
ncbi:hypothetical protein KCP75_21520 [Salmonella enterica subsp. enterica]|nr:hypothetical protein KCP75_21520 [Salmonella enterica subsp. enterica]